jgi:hypothetical protein
MEHDAHAEASSHAVPPPEDATVDDWARDDAEPMSVESSATPPEVAAVDSGADTPPAPSASAAVAGEGALLGPTYLCFARAVIRLICLDLSLLGADL